MGLDNARWASDGRLIVASISNEDDELFVGSFSGDRVLRVALEKG
jgi:hypothetical protein